MQQGEYNSLITSLIIFIYYYIYYCLLLLTVTQLIAEFKIFCASRIKLCKFSGFYSTY